MEQSAHEVANWQYYFAIAVFLVTYGFIISEKLNRAVIALFGAAIMIIFGVVDLHTAFTSHIQWETITLLIGMMILVHITSQSGVFEFVAIKAAKAAGGKPIRILLLLSLLTAGGSAFLDNVTTVLLIVPRSGARKTRKRFTINAKTRNLVCSRRLNTQIPGN